MMHDSNNCTTAKNHSYKTRQKHIPNRPNAKLSLYCKSFLYQAIACYSKLDKNLRDSPTIFFIQQEIKKVHDQQLILRYMQYLAYKLPYLAYNYPIWRTICIIWCTCCIHMCAIECTTLPCLLCV